MLPASRGSCELALPRGLAGALGRLYAEKDQLNAKIESLARQSASTARELAEARSRQDRDEVARLHVVEADQRKLWLELEKQKTVLLKTQTTVLLETQKAELEKQKTALPESALQPASARAAAGPAAPAFALQLSQQLELLQQTPANARPRTVASPPDTLALEELGRQLTGLPAHVVAAKLSVFKQGVRRPLLQQMEAHGLHGSIRRTGRLEVACTLVCVDLADFLARTRGFFDWLRTLDGGEPTPEGLRLHGASCVTLHPASFNGSNSVVFSSSDPQLVKLLQQRVCYRVSRHVRNQYARSGEGAAVSSDPPGAVEDAASLSPSDHDSISSNLS